MERFRNIILETPAADPAEPVRLPGQVEQALRDNSISNGLTVPTDLIEEIKTLANGATSS